MSIWPVVSGAVQHNTSAINAVVSISKPGADTAIHDGVASSVVISTNHKDNTQVQVAYCQEPHSKPESRYRHCAPACYFCVPNKPALVLGLQIQITFLHHAQQLTQRSIFAAWLHLQLQGKLSLLL